MSLEDSYDAWVRGLMGGGKYAATPRQTAEASEAVQQMQAQMQKMAMIIDAQNGTSVSGEVAGMVPAVGAPGEAAADGTAAAMDAMGRESATSTAGKARTRAAETATPR